MADTARRKTPLWLETILLLVIAVVLALLIKTLFVQAFYIPSSSMRPGLVVDDRILVQKMSYWFGGEPQRGDVVVFEDPGDWLQGTPAGPTNTLTRGMSAIGLYPSGGHLVKRVIGVPGDVIECCDEEGRLIVNGEPLDEDAFLARNRECDGPMVDRCQGTWTVGPVPEGELFVMGDNRAASADSSQRLRCTDEDTPCDATDAYVPEDLVVGRVFSVIWPLRHLDWLSRPDVFEDVPDAG
ncbi:signal peptidase I [Nocardioides nanhaiensis]|uniref:Signal peptidase I n=1 Tax=Nocardioides nanhaiensis TaxID=1476871 RepID=A0ABP8VYG1_9ACTN